MFLTLSTSTQNSSTNLKKRMATYSRQNTKRRRHEEKMDNNVKKKQLHGAPKVIPDLDLQVESDDDVEVVHLFDTSLLDPITLSCKDHREKLVDALWKSLSHKSSTDFNVKWGENIIRAHNLILELFLSPMKLILCSESMCTDYNDSLIEFLYTGSVTLPKYKLNNLRQVAEACNFKMLVDAIALETHGAANTTTTETKTENSVRAPPFKNVSSKPVSFKAQRKSQGVMTDNIDTLSQATQTNKYTNMTQASQTEATETNKSERKLDQTNKNKKRSREMIFDDKSDSGSSVKVLPVPKRKARKKFTPSCSLCRQSQEYMTQKAPKSDKTDHQCDMYLQSKFANGGDDAGSDDNGIPLNECIVCHKTYQKNDICARHLRRFKDILICNVCDASFLNASQLKLHKLKHHDIKPNACDKCDAKFVEKISLKRHRDKHDNIDSRAMVCEICGSKCSSLCTLAAHQRSHTGEKPFKCDYESCDKAFRMKATLSQHKLTHTNERPYPCNICGKGFRKKIHVQIHMRTHTGERPFECHLCDLACTTNGNLRAHLRTHAKGPPSSCRRTKRHATPSSESE